MAPMLFTKFTCYYLQVIQKKNQSTLKVFKRCNTLQKKKNLWCVSWNLSFPSWET